MTDLARPFKASFTGDVSEDGGEWRAKSHKGSWQWGRSGKARGAGRGPLLICHVWISRHRHTSSPSEGSPGLCSCCLPRRKGLSEFLKLASVGTAPVEKGNLLYCLLSWWHLAHSCWSRLEIWCFFRVLFSGVPSRVPAAFLPLQATVYNAQRLCILCLWALATASLTRMQLSTCSGISQLVYPCDLQRV